MNVKLKVLQGTQAGNELSVPGPKFLIGRDEDCHLRPNSDVISRHHCVIIIDGGYVGIRDFGSKNGTFVNDQRISGECELKTGDQLTIGPLAFSIHLDHALGGTKRPKVKDLKEAVARTAQIAAGDDIDISSWLDDGDEVAVDNLPDDTASALIGEADESKRESLDDTKEFQLKKRDTETVRPASDGEPGTPPGGIPGDEAEDSKSGDTQSAALDMLRKLREQKQGKK